MLTSATQVKVTLPNELHEFVSSRASAFGLTLSSYIKNLILNDVKDMGVPVRTASKKLEVSYQKALKERRKSVEVSDVAAFLDSL